MAKHIIIIVLAALLLAQGYAEGVAPVNTVPSSPSTTTTHPKTLNTGASVNNQQVVGSQVRPTTTTQPAANTPPQQNIAPSPSTTATASVTVPTTSQTIPSSPQPTTNEAQLTIQNAPTVQNQQPKQANPQNQNILDEGVDEDEEAFKQNSPFKAVKEGQQFNGKESEFSKKVQNDGTLDNQPFNSLDPIQTQKKISWQQVEQKMNNQQEQSKKEKFTSWIVEQKESSAFLGDGVVTQTFQTLIYETESFNFRWNPPKRQNIFMKIMVFEILPDGGLLIMRDNEQQEFIEVSSRNQGHPTYVKLGKVYIDRTISFNFDTDFKYFRLTNNIAKTVMVIVDLQKLQQTINIQTTIKNDHFALPVKKLEQIRQQVISGQKLREHSYKYQWGFLDNQYSHDSQLLGLTGLELAVMIAAAIVQVYFIKSLLDNRAVV